MVFVKPEGAGPEGWKRLSQCEDGALGRQALRLYERYHAAARTQLERLRRNELYYRGEHWSLVGDGEDGEPRPHTPVLWSTLDNLHADLTEACPRAVVQAQTAADRDRAATVNALLRSLLKRNGFPRVWHDLTGGMLRQGTDVLEVAWDPTLAGGLGDVALRRHAIGEFLFDPGAATLDDCEAVIHHRWESFDSLLARYPHAAARMVRDAGSPDGERALVFDLWWREPEPEDALGGQRWRVLWCRVAAGAVVGATPFGPDGRRVSVYDHGQYPFVVLPYDRLEGSLYGLGIIDRFKQAQWMVDLTDQMVLKNMMVSARNKLLVADGAGVDMDALTDWRTDVIRARDISDDAVRWFDKQPFAAGQMEYASQKMEQMKRESGQNEFARGEANSGVTAAAAIEALQEAAGKRSRKRIDCLYADCERAFRLALRVMSQFYTERRQFTLALDGMVEAGEVGPEHFLTADGTQIDYDLNLTAERAPAYRSAAHNEQVLAMVKAGLLPPSVGLQLMDFDRRDEALALLKALGHAAQ